jgi:transposase
MSNATFTTPDLDSFCLLDRMGLRATGQMAASDHAVLRAVTVEPDRWCRVCGAEGVARDTEQRRLAHVPLGWRPTILRVQVRRYRCQACGRVWREDLSKVAAPRSKLTRQAVLWAVKSVVVDRLTVARVASNLGVDWHTANKAVLDAGRELLIGDPSRFDGVEVIGVDEHAWRHTRKGDRYVTVVIDLTPVRDGRGPARLLDMVEGRSKAVFKDWLEAQDQAFRDKIQVVAMDGFTGFKTAAQEELPEAVEVMDPFHVVKLAGDALDQARQRVQQDTCGHRGRKGDPLYGVRRTLKTGADLLTDKQKARIEPVLADDRHAVVDVTWHVYQQVIAAYRHPNPREGRKLLERLIGSLASGVPKALTEAATLGRTLSRRCQDVLAYFDHPKTSNGPTEAINGRIENLRGNALGFRNLANYITRALLDTGGFKPKIRTLLT